MRITVTALLLLPQLLRGQAAPSTGIASTQGPSHIPSPLESARRAWTTIEAAIAAIGGRDALAQLRVITRTLEGVRSDWGQGLRPGQHSDNRPRWLSIRDYRNGRLLEQLADTVLGGQPVSFGTIARRDSAWSLGFVTRTVRAFPAAAVGAVRGRQFRRHPEGLLASAMQRPEQLRWGGTVEQDGRSEDVVYFVESDGDPVAAHFDAETHLLRRTVQVAPHSSFGELLVEVRYDDYRPVGDLILPHRYRDVQGGRVLQDLHVAVQRSESAPDSVFAPPAESRAPPPPASSVEVAPGVVVLAGSYTSLAVAMRDHIIIFEGGGSTGNTSAQIAEVRRRFPGLPIRYVIASHHHDDHLAGLRTHVAEGVTIVTTEHAAGVVRELAGSERILRPDALARNPQPPRLEIVGERRVFGDGPNRLEVYQIGPNPHADQILIGYVPAQKLVIQADLLDLADGRVGPAGRDTRAFADAIAKLGLQVDKVVAVHGGLGPADAIAKALSGGT